MPRGSSTISERQLSEFYYPIYIRLRTDGAVWDTILARGKDDPLRKAIGEQTEKNVLLPNHEAIVAIIQSKIHLAELDQASLNVLLKYVRHVTVYRAMRAAGSFDKDPIAVGEKWPSDFLPIVESATLRLQERYDSLLKPLQQR